MMGWLANLIRRARLRGLVDAAVQTVRAESLEADAKDGVERWQDYGFAANAVDGQGLVINWAGHTVVLRLDRIGERPAMAPYDVAIWHHEGHKVHMKAGKVVEVTCDHLVVNAAQDVTITSPVVAINASTSTTVTSPQVTATASTGITLTTPTVAASGNVTAGGNMLATGISQASSVIAVSSLKVASKEMSGHTHGGVQAGAGTSGPPT